MNRTNKRYITCDGNYAASRIAYMFSEVAAIYPISPSSTMAENADKWATRGKKNIFGDVLDIKEMQSEGGAAGALHGALQAGTLVTTFTASQGLLLMIPNMYKIAGELLPTVFHVSARTLATHALSIFGDHQDIYAVRQTGFAILASGSVQEVMDLTAVPHLTTIKTRIPFINFFDGYRTSHEIQKIEVIEKKDLAKLIDKKALQKFRQRALNPENPVTRGSNQTPDIFFQAREAINPYYDKVADAVEEYMEEIGKITGRKYHPFNYYGDPEAENIIVAMGSVTETIKETVNYLIKQGEKVGLIAVHLYRPFSPKYFFKAFPKSVKKIAVLDRTKELGANGQPLYLDIRDMFYDKEQRPTIVGGIYGLSSKDTTPAQIAAVYNNLKLHNPKNDFTIGIEDDVTFKSLAIGSPIPNPDKTIFESKFYGIGSDGTVGASQNTIKIIGNTTDKYVQGYFAYDSKKAGGTTVSHLRFGSKPIHSTYFVNTPDFVACNVPTYISKYNLLKGIKQGGTFLLNSKLPVDKTLEQLLTITKKTLAEKQIKFYIINATKIATEIGLGRRINTIMQSAFFKVTNIIPYPEAAKKMREAVLKDFSHKGDRVVQMNYQAIEAGSQIEQITIPEEWKNLQTEPDVDNDRPDFIKNFADIITNQEGDSLPVSAFKDRADGTFPAGSTQYEKRAIATTIPEWIAGNCIQCNLCSYVCPHAAIRPFLLNEEDKKGLPKNTDLLKAKGRTLAEYEYRIQVAPLDCTSCNVCVDTCPTDEKALVMKPLEDIGTTEEERWNYLEKKVSYKDHLVDKKAIVKNSQFAQPLFEFSGACSGCGETPYIKLITQLYGERMVIANATGCSSIYGAGAPSTPYRPNYKSGYGPAWANSLFEDNAEYGLGMALANKKLRNRIEEKLKTIIDEKAPTKVKEAAQQWIEKKESKSESRKASDELIEILNTEKAQWVEELLELKHFFAKKSMWIIGGDGWAYDIGFGGLDHVIATGEDVNILVLDTEVYSNTGGQSSKSTPLAALAKFAGAGKKIRKKDLGTMVMAYGYVYVAQVAMGANHAQTLKAIREAEAYNGPSIVIAYSTCMEHGITGGMGNSMRQMKNAVEAGYWINYRYNPQLEKEGKNPFQIDSKEPDWSKFKDFLNSEVRFSALMKKYPEKAQELYDEAQKNAEWKYNNYKKLAKMENFK